MIILVVVLVMVEVVLVLVVKDMSFLFENIGSKIFFCFNCSLKIIKIFFLKSNIFLSQFL